jgi:hypothetical protein
MVFVVKPMYNISLFGIVTINPPPLYNKYILIKKKRKKEKSKKDHA